MFSRPSFALFLCIVILTAFSNGKPQNSSIKPSVKTNRDQSFVVNNNCGLAKSESEMLAHIKATVDSIAAKCGKEPVCPDGWILHVNTCFLLIDIPTLDWSEARRNCQNLGGDLAKITSGTEYQFILDLIARQQKTKGNAVWLGLHRKADNKFYWADNTLPAGYNNWDTGEPNNAGQGEKCSVIIGNGSSRGKWNDVPCTRGNNAIAKNAPVFLCEKKARH